MEFGCFFPISHSVCSNTSLRRQRQTRCEMKILHISIEIEIGVQCAQENKKRGPKSIRFPTHHAPFNIRNDVLHIIIFTFCHVMTPPVVEDVSSICSLSIFPFGVDVTVHRHRLRSCPYRSKNRTSKIPSNTNLY